MTLQIQPQTSVESFAPLEALKSAQPSPKSPGAARVRWRWCRTLAELALLFIIVSSVTVSGWMRGRVFAPMALAFSTTADPNDSRVRETQQSIAWTQYAVNRLQRYEIPLWDPHVQMGIPLIGIGRSAVFFPTTFLHVFWPAKWSWLLAAWIKLLAAAGGTWLLARRYGLLPPGRILAASAFALSGLLAWAPHGAAANVACLAPWAMLAIERLLQRNTAGQIATAAAVLALIIFGGDPAAIASVGICMIALMLARVISPGIPDLKPSMAVPAVIGDDQTQRIPGDGNGSYSTSLDHGRDARATGHADRSADTPTEIAAAANAWSTKQTHPDRPRLAAFFRLFGVAAAVILAAAIAAAQLLPLLEYLQHLPEISANPPFRWADTSLFADFASASFKTPWLIGIAPATLALWAMLFQRRMRATRIWMAILVICLLLTGLGVWMLLHHAPSSLAVTFIRVGLFTGPILAIAIIAGIGMDGLAERVNRAEEIPRNLHGELHASGVLEKAEIPQYSIENQRESGLSASAGIIRFGQPVHTSLPPKSELQLPPLPSVPPSPSGDEIAGKPEPQTPIQLGQSAIRLLKFTAIPFAVVAIGFIAIGFSFRAAHPSILPIGIRLLDWAAALTLFWQLAAYRVVPPRALAGAVFGLAIIELNLLAIAAMPASKTPRVRMPDDSPMISIVNSAADQRIWAPPGVLQPALASAIGITDVRGAPALPPAQAEMWIAASRRDEKIPANIALLFALGGRIESDGSTHLAINPPLHAWVVPSADFFPTRDTLLAEIGSSVSAVAVPSTRPATTQQTSTPLPARLNPQQSVMIDPPTDNPLELPIARYDGEPVRNWFRQTGGECWTVDYSEISPEKIMVTPRPQMGGWLVVSDRLYPGWSAFLDGEGTSTPAGRRGGTSGFIQTPIVPAFGCLRAIFITPKTKDVEFVYDPPSWRWGIFLTSAGVMAWLLTAGGAALTRPRALP